MNTTSWRALLALLLVTAALLGGAPPAGAAPRRPPYVPPVDAPVTDPFRAPATPYGPGNRGIEFATPPGTPVVASAAGVVVFSGLVAGSLHVTISHRGGIRTSYSYLAATSVVAGQVVSQGTVVGVTGAMLHVGARRGSTYIDPASLWRRSGPPHVALVPLSG